MNIAYIPEATISHTSSFFLSTKVSLTAIMHISFVDLDPTTYPSNHWIFGWSVPSIALWDFPEDCVTFGTSKRREELYISVLRHRMRQYREEVRRVRKLFS